jgi:hypothetical protein
MDDSLLAEVTSDQFNTEPVLKKFFSTLTRKLNYILLFEYKLEIPEYTTLTAQGL